MRPIRRGALAGLAATLLLAGPAAAHPLFDPDEVPADSLAEVTLDLAHGCVADEDGEADEGDGQPTREVAIEVPGAVSHLAPAEADGWDLDVEEGDAGATAVVVYTAQDDTDEPAPRFDLEVVIEGEPGDEIHWRVMQACDEATHRWVGTDEEPAADPAITVTLLETDPDAPPPPDADPEDPVTPPDDEAATDDEDPAATDDTDDTDVEPEEVDEQDLTADEDEDGAMPGWLLIVVLVVTLVIAGVVLSLRTRGDGEADATDGTG